MSPTYGAVVRPIKHPEFYANVHMVEIQIDNTLFRVDINGLRRQAKVLEDVFSIPPSVVAGQPEEGTAENPIQFTGLVTVDDFAAFLTWIGRNDERPVPQDPQILIAILRVSHMWHAPKAFEDVKYQIEWLNLPHAQMVELGLQYNIDEWVTTAIPILVKAPLNTFTDLAVSQIGPTAFRMIAKSRETLTTQRNLIATVPLLPSDYRPLPHCSSHSRCLHVWKERWIMLVVMEIIHPTRPIPLTSIPGLITASAYPGMTPHCKEDFVRLMLASQRLGVEEKIWDGTVDAILRHYNILA
ncbi:hypothetical protein CCMSSC00406_0009541 [Pleurotus cornucopiae]|uniref:Uncharacterized protein n=1 Tax=Pleurotus cornucopiae TaxID=5321 RepID=A0ACB7IQ22_PLECO|nr:hypothetical protein CCMSSC00406_0009541 [Pleurotus cornucopiae]